MSWGSANWSSCTKEASRISDGRPGQPWGGSMVSLPIRRIEARTFCHATEEEARVATALAFACPVGDTSRESLEGYFGNPLVRLTRRVEKAAAIRTVWERWTAPGLPARVGEDAGTRLDEERWHH